ncbi:MAG: cytidine deaminase [Planctomycetota bacterium]|jgi:cytidine deaminase|nr:cytidine deaminase [Planctomycetota bacterium]
MISAQELLDMAKAVAQNAHCPYSKFPVGAAVLWEDGTVDLGVNVENASSPLGVCAERTAVANGVSRGERALTMIAVWADVEKVVSPCGGCRQVMLEFAPDDLADLQVILGGRDQMRLTNLALLLPEAFRSY